MARIASYRNSSMSRSSGFWLFMHSIVWGCVLHGTCYVDNCPIKARSWDSEGARPYENPR
jgi:hypothetical protein